MVDNYVRHVAVALLLIILLYVSQDYLGGFRPYLTSIIGFYLIFYSLFSGLLALFVGFTISLFSYVVSMPLIAPLYGLMLGYIIYFYKTLVYIFIEKILSRYPPLQRLRKRVITSQAYKRFSRWADSLLARAGLKKVHILRVYDVTTCPHCMRYIPRESRACMYCKKEVMLEPT